MLTLTLPPSVFAENSPAQLLALISAPAPGPELIIYGLARAALDAHNRELQKAEQFTDDFVRWNHCNQQAEKHLSVAKAYLFSILTYREAQHGR